MYNRTNILKYPNNITIKIINIWEERLNIAKQQN